MSDEVSRLRTLYLDLIESTLIGTIYEDPSDDPFTCGQFNSLRRERGEDWPSQAHSMIGRKRMR